MPEVKWTEERLDRLMKCRTDEQLRNEFPGTPIETLKRRQRMVRADNPAADKLGTLADLLDLRLVDLCASGLGGHYADHTQDHNDR